MRSKRSYLPAAGADWLLPIYDPVVKLLGFGKARDELLKLAPPRPGDSVLDIGCGTGTFAVEVKKRFPEAEVTGLDPDPKALERAAQKASAASVSVEFVEGFADEMPFPDQHFDTVFSSFMFHHLPHNVQAATSADVRRVLKPGGTFVLLDFGGPGSEGHSLMDHVFHSGNQLEHNSEETVLSMLRESGFPSPAKVADTKLFLRLVRVNYFQAAS